MNRISEADKANLLAFIDAHSFFAVAGHKEPDGDCISSTLSLASFLSRRGKKVTVLSDGPFKRPETRKYERLFQKTLNRASLPADAALFLVDCSTLDRTGGLEPTLQGMPCFIIDHHKTSSCGDGNCIIDSSSPATAFLIQQIYEAFGDEISQEDAYLLFFGTATDTGFFRFLNENSGDVFRAASRLVDRGISPREIYSVMSGGKSFESRRLLGRMLDRCLRYFDGRLIITWETLEDTCTFGPDVRDSDMLYQLLLAVEGVEAIVCVRQDTETFCTVGFRSRDEVDVSAVAAAFGGGGHKNAAGLGIDGTIDTLIPRLVAEFKQTFGSEP